MRVWARLFVVTGLALSATACASRGPLTVESVRDAGNGVRVEIPNRPLECVPFARGQTGIAIHGDAWRWWARAAGRYARGRTPRIGAVLVFSREGGPAGGHVAVVRSITSRRVIRVDHANWLGRGRIYLNDPVADVSAANDWSQVRVWNPDTGAWGGRTYPTDGFVGPAPQTVAAATPDS